MSASREEQMVQARFERVVEAAVMGAGAWGTALAKVLADAGNDVRLWARRAELADELNETHRNSGYLSHAWSTMRRRRAPTHPVQ